MDYNFGYGAGGALSGLGAGAMVGSAFSPGLGTAIGAGAGGLLGAAAGFLGGDEYDFWETYRKALEEIRPLARQQAAFNARQAGNRAWARSYDMPSSVRSTAAANVEAQARREGMIAADLAAAQQALGAAQAGAVYEQPEYSGLIAGFKALGQAAPYVSQAFAPKSATPEMLATEQQQLMDEVAARLSRGYGATGMAGPSAGGWSPLSSAVGWDWRSRPFSWSY